MNFDNFYDTDEPKVFSVTQLNSLASSVLSEQIPAIWIQGEISNFVQAASGHWYFTLKDKQAAVKAVMFRGRAAGVDFRPDSGMQVEVFATVSLYEPRGDYQLQITQIRQAGLGNLHEAFLKIKAKLEAEGLFDPALKQEIPRFIQTVGIVTSLGAAALYDVLASLRRRAPHVKVIIYPSLVQGAQAPAEIRQVLAQAQLRAEVDVLLLVRGGGSLEDLWAFNDENLARFIHQMRLPVISGVGHETDFTITDFVADLRAPTPTAAAELATYSQADWLAYVKEMVKRMSEIQRRRLDNAAMRLDKTSACLISPQQRLLQWQQKQDFLSYRLVKAGELMLSRKRQAYVNSVKSWQQSCPDIKPYARELQRLMECLPRAHQQVLRYQQQRLNGLRSTLCAFNPRAVLERGYSITYDEQGKIVRDARTLVEQQKLRIELAQGSTEVQVVTRGVTDKH